MVWVYALIGVEGILTVFIEVYLYALMVYVRFWRTEIQVLGQYTNLFRRVRQLSITFEHLA